MLSHESKVTVGSILPTMDMLPFSLLRGLVVDLLTSQALHLFLAAFTRRLMIGLSPVQRFSFRIWSWKLDPKYRWEQEQEEEEQQEEQ